ncbi:MAG: flagellar basal body P-ring protein FlgI [Fimbriimonas sp.]
MVAVAPAQAAKGNVPKVEVTAQLKDIARFRGIRTNTLTGVGLVLGLEGTGDTQRISATRSALTNYLRRSGLDVDAKQLDSKNAALVMVTAELPPFSVNGQKIDVTITSIGDAKSLRNGTLLMTELKAASNPDTVYATASGAVSVGGFSVSQNGNSQIKGFVTVGRIPAGGVVEQGAPTTTVYNGRMYLELDEPDLTTASRIEDAIRKRHPEFRPVAQNGGTIEVVLPEGLTPTAAMARLEKLTVEADTAALIVINEKTGAIVMGGNIKLSPVAFAYGSLSIRVEEQSFVSQPAPFSNGKTEVVKDTQTGAKEDPAKTAVTTANTTVADLAQIFRKLNLSAGDIIAILQALRQQGALKARVVMQ